MPKTKLRNRRMTREDLVVEQVTSRLGTALDVVPDRERRRAGCTTEEIEHTKFMSRYWWRRFFERLTAHATVTNASRCLRHEFGSLVRRWTKLAKMVIRRAQEKVIWDTEQKLLESLEA